MPAQHTTQWSGLLSDLQVRTHDLAAVGRGMVREGTYPLPSALHGMAQLLSSHCLVTVVAREMYRLYAQGPPGDDQALQAWAQLQADGEVPTDSLRFAALVCMALSTHTSAHAEF